MDIVQISCISFNNGIMDLVKLMTSPICWRSVRNLEWSSAECAVDSTIFARGFSMCCKVGLARACPPLPYVEREGLAVTLSGLSKCSIRLVAGCAMVIAVNWCEPVQSSKRQVVLAIVRW